MKSTFVMSIVGPDIPGSIKSIAETTRGAGGEWTTSKVMRLDGQLSAMMKVVIESEREDELKSTLKSAFSGLQFFFSDAVSRRDAATKSISLVVDCKDRPGLTKDINTILTNLDLVVENMECNRAHVSSIGEAVFTAKVSLSVPEDVTGEAVADEIEALSDDVRVSVL
ncbi:ACT domain-containing protein [Desulfosediminicola flagellatus]|uniref:ACT domain-containing protein n=1 Tax=Desulfosediminicola flagellatus TaxID=2569541 RepID=UPI0010AC66FA|nr:ACT domain-containing protein [Desulfosediminicola flagellatus]